MRRRSEADQIVRDAALGVFDDDLEADSGSDRSETEIEDQAEELNPDDPSDGYVVLAQLSLFDDVGQPNPESFPLKIFRPRTRDECADIPRPCPFVSCRYNMYLDVREDGAVRFNFPDREPHEMVASCSLDLASDGPRTLDIIGALMGMSKERARQLEATGLRKVKDLFGGLADD